MERWIERMNREVRLRNKNSTLFHFTAIRAIFLQQGGEGGANAGGLRRLPAVVKRIKAIEKIIIEIIKKHKSKQIFFLKKKNMNEKSVIKNC